MSSTGHTLHGAWAPPRRFMHRNGTGAPEIAQSEAAIGVPSGRPPLSLRTLSQCHSGRARRAGGRTRHELACDGACALFRGLPSCPGHGKASQCARRRSVLHPTPPAPLTVPQVLVDLKQFQRAIQDFDEAERQQPAGYKSLGLLNNRALAYEGLYMWKEADLDYSEAIRLGQALGYQQPYILNSRGNVRVSLGRYAEARDDYKEAVAV